METFRSISFTACFLGIVITIFNSLYPSEKFAKQLKITFSLIFILCLIKPVIDGSIEFPEISETVSASSEYYSELKDNADNYFIDSIENNISSSLKYYLEENGIYIEEIKTSINISENNSISINEVKVTIDNAENAEAVKKYLDKKTEGTANIIVVANKKEGQGTDE